MKPLIHIFFWLTTLTGLPATTFSVDLFEWENADALQLRPTFASYYVFMPDSSPAEVQFIDEGSREGNASPLSRLSVQIHMPPNTSSGKDPLALPFKLERHFSPEDPNPAIHYRSETTKDLDRPTIEVRFAQNPITKALSPFTISADFHRPLFHRYRHPFANQMHFLTNPKDIFRILNPNHQNQWLSISSAWNPDPTTGIPTLLELEWHEEGRREWLKPTLNKYSTGETILMASEFSHELTTKKFGMPVGTKVYNASWDTHPLQIGSSTTVSGEVYIHESVEPRFVLSRFQNVRVGLSKFERLTIDGYWPLNDDCRLVVANLIR